MDVDAFAGVEAINAAYSGWMNDDNRKNRS